MDVDRRAGQVRSSPVSLTVNTNAPDGDASGRRDTGSGEVSSVTPARSPVGQ